MKTSDFSITFLVNQTPEETFNAINNVRGWWKADMEGSSQKLNDEFTVRFGDMHVSTQKLIEVIPDKKVVWLVTDSQLNFVEKKHEWTNTTICFDFTNQDNQSKFDFTHVGLIPDVQCYNGCSKGWTQYISGSLFKLITEGKGISG